MKKESHERCGLMLKLAESLFLYSGSTEVLVRCESPGKCTTSSVSIPAFPYRYLHSRGKEDITGKLFRHNSRSIPQRQFPPYKRISMEIWTVLVESRCRNRPQCTLSKAASQNYTTRFIKSVYANQMWSWRGMGKISWTNFVKIKMYYTGSAGPVGRAVKGVGLQPLAWEECAFESHRRHGCLSVLNVLDCQVEFSASDWLQVHRSATECDSGAWIMRRHWPNEGCWATVKKNIT